MSDTNSMEEWPPIYQDTDANDYSDWVSHTYRKTTKVEHSGNDRNIYHPHKLSSQEQALLNSKQLVAMGIDDFKVQIDETADEYTLKYHFKKWQDRMIASATILPCDRQETIQNHPDPGVSAEALRRSSVEFLRKFNIMALVDVTENKFVRLDFTSNTDAAVYASEIQKPFNSVAKRAREISEEMKAELTRQASDSVSPDTPPVP